MKKHIPILLTAMAAVFGPASPVAAETTQPSHTDDAAQKPARPTLSPGMTADEVRGLVGEPQKVKTVTRDGVEAEVWIYAYRVQTGVKMSSVGMEEVPYFDIASNSIQTRTESVSGRERINTTETTELLMVEGKLVAAKRYRTTDSTFD